MVWLHHCFARDDVLHGQCCPVCFLGAGMHGGTKHHVCHALEIERHFGPAW